ncbi:hypothetical protein KFE98_20125 [bacterium SCSIO 12741]|nr:hypothetical protein KFE98_20125 [bacterium SCSIO 12741]
MKVGLILFLGLILGVTGFAKDEPKTKTKQTSSVRALMYYVHSADSHQYVIPTIESQLRKLTRNDSILFDTVVNFNSFDENFKIQYGIFDRYTRSSGKQANPKALKDHRDRISKFLQRGYTSFLVIHVATFQELVEIQFWRYKRIQNDKGLYVLDPIKYESSSLFIDPRKKDYKTRLEYTLKQVFPEANRPPDAQLYINDSWVPNNAGGQEVWVESGKPFKLRANVSDFDSDSSDLWYHWTFRTDSDTVKVKGQKGLFEMADLPEQDYQVLVSVFDGIDSAHFTFPTIRSRKRGQIILEREETEVHSPRNLGIVSYGDFGRQGLNTFGSTVKLKIKPNPTSGNFNLDAGFYQLQDSKDTSHPMKFELTLDSNSVGRNRFKLIKETNDLCAELNWQDSSLILHFNKALPVGHYRLILNGSNDHLNYDPSIIDIDHVRIGAASLYAGLAVGYESFTIDSTWKFDNTFLAIDYRLAYRFSLFRFTAGLELSTSKYSSLYQDLAPNFKFGLGLWLASFSSYNKGGLFKNNYNFYLDVDYYSKYVQFDEEKYALSNLGIGVSAEPGFKKQVSGKLLPTFGVHFYQGIDFGTGITRNRLDYLITGSIGLTIYSFKTK